MNLNKSLPKRDPASRVLQENLSSSNLTSKGSLRVKPVSVSKPFIQKLGHPHHSSIEHEPASLIEHLSHSKVSLPEPYAEDSRLRPSERVLYEEQIAALRRKIALIEGQQQQPRRTATPSRESEGLTSRLDTQAKTIALLKQENANLLDQLSQKEAEKRHGSFSASHN
jgi:hypothetical protein